MDENLKNLLLKMAITAPSADNSQPWKFHCKEDSLSIYIDEARSGGPSDKSYMLSDMSVGAVLENITQTADFLEITYKLTLFPEGETNAPFYVARFDFDYSQAIPIKNLSGLDYIQNRHTDRSFPWKGPIENEIKTTLTEACNKLPETQLIWLNKIQKKQALKIMSLAESLRFATKELHQELFSSIRFDASWKEAVTEGLAPASLNVEWFAKPVFKACRSWKVMNFLNIFGAAKGFGFRSAVVPNLLSPELLLITVKDSRRTSIINGGRALQRCWLKASQQNLALQPFAAAGVFNLAEALPCPPIHIDTIRKELKKITLEAEALIFLRVGKANDQQPVRTSVRREISHFI